MTLEQRIAEFSNIHFRDRIWTIEIDDSIELISDYNWEITGFTSGLKQIPDIGKEIYYSGNAYYVLPELDKRGFKITKVDSRR